MKKIGMPTPDAALKDFFKDNAIFASVFNGYFFNNDEVINPDELEQADTAYTESVNAEMKIDKINRTEKGNDGTDYALYRIPGRRRCLLIRKPAQALCLGG